MWSVFLVRGKSGNSIFQMSGNPVSKFLASTVPSHSLGSLHISDQNKMFDVNVVCLIHRASMSCCFV